MSSRTRRLMMTITSLVIVAVTLLACAAPAPAPAPAAAPTQAPAQAAPAATEAPAAEPAATAAPAAASGEQTVLRFQSWNGNLVRTNPWWDEICKGFEATHPGVTIESNFIAFAQYLPTLEAQIAGNELPDIFWAGVKAQELGDAGVIINWNDYVDKAFLDNFHTGPLRQLRFHGDKQYALPMNAQLFAIYANDKILKEVGVEYPETWDDLIAITPKLREAGYIPLAFGNSAKNVAADFVLPLIAQYGGNVYDMDAGKPEDWGTESFVKAQELLKKLVDNKVLPDGINGISEEQGWQLAIQGKAAMLWSSNSVATYIAQKAPEEYRNSISVRKQPAIAKDQPHYTGDGTGRGLAVPTNSKNKDLAIEFLKYFFQPEVYKTFVTKGADTSALKSNTGDIVDPLQKQMMQWMDDGVDHILFGKGNWDAICNSTQAVIDGTLTPKDAVDKIVKDIADARAK